MGLGTRRTVLLFLPALIGGSAMAAPKLRLTDTTVGPATIAVGSNATAPAVEAYNVGDGNLNLSVSSNQTWAQATVGASRNCSQRPGSCLPININFQTSALAKGTYSAIVTVRDPAALDAPQTITVIAQMGTAVPDSVNMYVAPNGSQDFVPFTSNSVLAGAASTQSGGNWLSFAMDGVGSFLFSKPYRIFAKHLPGMAEGIYRGTYTSSLSTFPADNKPVAVTLQVTSQPIAQVVPATLSVRGTQDGPKQVAYLSVSNRGLGAFNIGGVTANSSSGSNWLSATQSGGLVTVACDPASLAPGVYQGTITVASNGVNGTQTVPVSFEVLAQAAPFAQYRGAVNNATYEGGDTLGAGTIAAVFGEQFILGDPVSASSLPLGTTLGGVRVLVNDQPAPVFYVSYSQVNFLIPYDVSTSGDAVIKVERGGQLGNGITVPVAARAPRLLRLGIGDYGIVVNSADSSFPIPTTPGIKSRPARSGETMVIYAIGLGQTTPAVQNGAAAPSSPLATVPDVSVVFGGQTFVHGVSATPLFAGLTPGFVGLYQVNVTIPDGVGGDDNMPLYLNVNGLPTNRVTIAIK
jgi:uncharacterized protein (TIGR03437 family)